MHMLALISRIIVLSVSWIHTELSQGCRELLDPRVQAPDFTLAKNLCSADHSGWGYA